MCHFTAIFGYFARFQAFTTLWLTLATWVNGPAHPSHTITYIQIPANYTPKYPIFDPQYTTYDIFSLTSETKCNENAGEMKITPHFIYHIWDIYTKYDIFASLFPIYNVSIPPKPGARSLLVPIAFSYIYYIEYPTIIFCEVTPNNPSTTYNQRERPQRNKRPQMA